MKKTIYLIRHGETEYNRLGIIQGSGVDSSLNEQGRQQARRFYEKYREANIGRVFTSALKRTHESVEHFIVQDALPHTVMAELNEISWGAFENVEPEKNWKQHYFDTIHAWSSGHLDVVIAGGENPLQVQARLRRAIEAIQQSEEEELLVCMHGRALKIMLCTLLNIPLTRMEEFAHSNLCLYKLELNKEGWQIVIHNDISHLQTAQTG